MKLSSKAMFVGTLLAMTGLDQTSGAEADLIEPLRSSVKQAVGEFDRINETRKNALREAAQFITERIAADKPANLTFICTHNSRRSHLSQLWAQTAAIYYGLPGVTVYSGGTEATACNIRTVRALQRAGFSIADSTGGTNPIYLAQISETRPPVKIFSKRFSDEFNPQSDFMALFSCDEADAGCPLVKGAAARVPVHYVDPKISDNSPSEQATYDERSRQIAREMFFLMSQVKK